MTFLPLDTIFPASPRCRTWPIKSCRTSEEPDAGTGVNDVRQGGGGRNKQNANKKNMCFFSYLFNLRSCVSKTQLKWKDVSLGHP